MTTTETAKPQTSPFCELCDTTIQDGEAYFTNRTLHYHEKCAAQFEDGGPDHDMSWIVANNRRLLRPSAAQS